MITLITGPARSGKTFIARSMAEFAEKSGIKVKILDVDTSLKVLDDSILDLIRRVKKPDSEIQDLIIIRPAEKFHFSKSTDKIADKVDRIISISLNY